MNKKYMAYVGITDDEILECVDEYRKCLENQANAVEFHDKTIKLHNIKLPQDEIEIKVNKYFNKLKEQQQYHITHGEFKVQEVEIFEDVFGDTGDDMNYCESWLPGFRYWINNENNI